MSERTVNPELFHLSASLLNWARIADSRGGAAGSLAGDATFNRGQTSTESLQLRWMVAPAIGLPRHPFAVYYRQEVLLLQRLPNAFGQVTGAQRMEFPELMGVLQFEFNLTSPGAFLFAFSPNGALVAAASAPAGATGIVTLTLQNSGIAYVLFAASGNLVTVYGLSSRAIVNSPGWTRVETVGLPVDPSVFAGSGYSTANQGFVSAPVLPVDAAKRRLHAGAPLLGWPTEIRAGVPAPPWNPPGLHPLIGDLQQNVLGSVLQMLSRTTGQSADLQVTLQQTIPTPAQVGGGVPAPLAQPSQATYSPLAILLLAAGSDPFNALGLGFGTAYTLAQLQGWLANPQVGATRGEDGRRFEFFGFMVTADFDMSLFGVEIKGQLADFITNNLQLGLTPAPTDLTAEVKVLNPPLVRDHPFTGTLDARWDRPAALFPNQTVAASYAVARSAPAQPARLLNTRRLSGGFLPYVASLAPDGDPAAPVVFEDVHVTPPSGGGAVTYSVAAQDWFGVWSPWTSASTSFPPEPVVGPTVTDAQLALTESATSPYAAALTAQVAYNWTTRSPNSIDILVSLLRPGDQVSPLPAQTAPSGVQFSVGGPMRPLVELTFDAAGKPSVTGAPGTTVTQLPPPSHASPQHDVRVYQVVIPGFSLDFAGANEIVALVFATGRENVNPTPVTTTKPRVAHVMSPAPPPTPTYDSIVWASLPDQRGISRAHLTWNSQGAAAGTNYLIYTATETGLLGAAGAAPADLTDSYAKRLAALRALDLTKCRATFQRVDTTPARLADPWQEIELPRGTRVIHAFVVTAISPNNIETPFPTNASQFIAVAVPYVETPRAPRIYTRLLTNAGVSQAQVHVESRPGVTPDRFLLYRTQREGLSRDLDLMGPPVANSDLAGWTKTPVDPLTGTWTAYYTDPTPLGATHPWQRVWYRAVALADDHLTDPTGNLLGALGGRSSSSSAAAIVVPPPAPPSLSAIMVGLVDHPDQTVLIRFQTAAPVAATALGSHRVTVTVADPTQPAATATTWRLAIALERIPGVAASPTSGVAGNLFRLPASSGLNPIGVWVPRPARSNGSTTAFRVTVTLTDPIDRTTEQMTTVNWWP